ncbi:hypothetical protein SAY86_024670 [Trapa natans]|uniref:Uncharacterized protein n=1 Tax=Trapa natans TaxID=22666 RepID=A0AAN7M4R6_TRANT|nr:hypothetical protein SAY86_024670 [Trapa natans]
MDDFSSLEIIRQYLLSDNTFYFPSVTGSHLVFDQTNNNLLLPAPAVKLENNMPSSSSSESTNLQYCCTSPTSRRLDQLVIMSRKTVPTKHEDHQSVVIVDPSDQELAREVKLIPAQSTSHGLSSSSSSDPMQKQHNIRPCRAGAGAGLASPCNISSWSEEEATAAAIMETNDQSTATPLTNSCCWPEEDTDNK